MKSYPIHIASRVERIGGVSALELLIADFADEIFKDGDKHGAKILRDAADIIKKMPEKNLSQQQNVQECQRKTDSPVAYYRHDGTIMTVGSFGCDATPDNPVPLYAMPSYLAGLNHSGDVSEKVCFGNSPAISDGWIKCSEQMPPIGEPANVAHYDKLYPSIYFWNGQMWDDLEERLDPVHPAEITQWTPVKRPQNHE